MTWLRFRKKIHILLTVNDLIVGVVQKLAIDQLRYHDRERFSFTLLTLMDFPGKETFYELVPKDVKVIRCHFSGLLDVRSWRGLYGIVREINRDIVQTSMFFGNAVFRLLKPFFGYRVISAEHNTDKRPLWKRALDHILSWMTFVIVADSQTVIDHVSKEEWIPKNKFRLIYNGIETSIIRERLQKKEQDRREWRERLGIGMSAPVFLNVGRLTTQKAQMLAIDGLAQLRKNQPDAHLAIIGDGSLLKLLKQHVEAMGLKGYVHFLLSQNQDGLFQAYNASDIFFLTSTREGFCIAAMEALAFGLPVLSTRVAGVIEYLQEGVAGYFMERTPENVAASMKKVLELSPEDRSRMSRAATATAQDFGVDAYIRKYRELYEGCLKSEERLFIG
ncbi:glycosyltransferase [Patescibacteria group bacterium]|nr:glycosyltransferase [Patescibacteria group bacterium]